METAFALLQWLWAPVAGCTVSWVYFLRADELAVARRLLVALHGILLALLYSGALLVFALGLSRQALVAPFWLLFCIPAASAFLALRWMGPWRKLHLLLLVLAGAAAWSWFVGTMAVTGNWL